MRLGQLAIDLGPLRTSRDFRFIFGARVVSVLGLAMTEVAVAVQVYQLTRSSLQVGLVSLVMGLTIVVATLSGGIIADRFDRRMVIIVSRGVAGVGFVLLAANALLPHPQVWLVYVCAVINGLSAVSGVALMAVTPAIVAPHQLTAAGALVTMTTQIGAIIGPSLAGVVVTWAGFSAAYGLTALATGITMVLVGFMRPLPPHDGAAGQAKVGPIRSLQEGFQFIARDRMIASLLLIDVCAMLFAMPQALFPQLADEYLGGDARTAGLLYAAPAVGALISAATSGWLGHVRRPGRILVGAVIAWGAAMVGFGLTPLLLPGVTVVALVFLAMAGASDNISEILRRSLLQQYTPNALQGRISSVWLAQATVSPAAGNTVAGLTARLLGPAVAITVGGVACVIGALGVSAAFPVMRRAEAPAPDQKTSDKSDVATAAKDVS